MEIVVATLSGVYVLQEDLTEVDRYENTGAGLFPPPVLADIDADGALEMIVGAWFPGQLASVELGYSGTRAWSTFGGNNQHQGSTPPRDVEGLGDDPVVTINTVDDVIDDAILEVTGRAAKELDKASDKLSKAYRHLLRGKPRDGIDQLKRAIDELQDVPPSDYDTEALEEIVAGTAIQFLEMYIDRVDAVIGPSNDDVIDALERLANAEEDFADGDWKRAADEAKKGADDLRNFLHGGWTSRTSAVRRSPIRTSSGCAGSTTRERPCSN